MTSSLEGLPTKAKEAPSPHEVRLALLDTYPVFQCLRDKKKFICKKKIDFDKNENTFKLDHNVRDLHNGSTYDYHFIINQLAKEFDGQVECLGENAEKCITFSVPIKKYLNNSKTIVYTLKVINSFRFMSTSLSKLVKYLSERLHSDNCTD